MKKRRTWCSWPPRWRASRERIGSPCSSCVHTHTCVCVRVRRPRPAVCLLACGTRSDKLKSSAWSFWKLPADRLIDKGYYTAYIDHRLIFHYLILHQYSNRIRINSRRLLARVLASTKMSGKPDGKTNLFSLIILIFLSSLSKSLFWCTNYVQLFAPRLLPYAPHYF